MKKNKTTRVLIAVLALLLVALLAMVWVIRDSLFSDIRNAFEEDPAAEGTVPGAMEEPEAPQLEDFLGGRDPATFTWEEYMTLTPDQRMQFPDYFESMDAFNSWYDEVEKTSQQEEPDMSDLEDFLNGRDPATFTWEEYQALTPEQQARFPDYFESLDAFNSWYDSVMIETQPEETEAPEEPEETETPEPDQEDFLNGRDPATFTWEEYQALTPEQQAMFPDYFESLDAFDSWYSSVMPETEPTVPEVPDEPESDPEDFLNGRDPETFTWEEYQALTPEQQAMFPDYFESYDAYLQWKNNVQP